jgi:hypothetical protein
LFGHNVELRQERHLQHPDISNWIAGGGDYAAPMGLEMDLTLVLQR